MRSCSHLAVIWCLLVIFAASPVESAIQIVSQTRSVRVEGTEAQTVQIDAVDNGPFAVQATLGPSSYNVFARAEQTSALELDGMRAQGALSTADGLSGSFARSRSLFEVRFRLTSFDVAYFDGFADFLQYAPGLFYGTASVAFTLTTNSGIQVFQETFAPGTWSRFEFGRQAFLVGSPEYVLRVDATGYSYCAGCTNPTSLRFGVSFYVPAPMAATAFVPAMIILCRRRR